LSYVVRPFLQEIEFVCDIKDRSKIDYHLHIKSSLVIKDDFHLLIPQSVHVRVVLGFDDESLGEGVFELAFLFMLGQLNFFVTYHLRRAIISFSPESLQTADLLHQHFMLPTPGVPLHELNSSCQVFHGGFVDHPLPLGSSVSFTMHVSGA
jgi:hypothetical protein